MGTTEWHILSDDARLMLSREALHAAATAIVTQAEQLAGEIEAGTLADHGGASALRLLAAVIRAGGTQTPPIVGHA